ncbi:MAG: methyl-accepting chemotaxis protein [Planctomycetota bacterium]
MSMLSTFFGPFPTGKTTTKRFAEAQTHHTAKIDRIFRWLLPLQWLLLLGTAAVVSPRTWAGSAWAVHDHVIAALVVGGLATILPTLLAWKQAGHSATRLAIAAGQAVLVGLYIHLLAGRIEAHFAVFVMLAVLVVYRDARPLLLAAGIIAVDHIARALLWPQSLIGKDVGGLAVALEHAAYVVAEVTFLIYSTRLMRSDAIGLIKRGVEMDRQRRALEQGAATMGDRLKEIVTSGDLTRTFRGQDDERLEQLAGQLEDFSSGLAETLREIRGSSERSAGAATELAATAEQLDATSKSIEQNAQDARDEADRSMDRASEGANVIQRTIGGFDQIKSAVTSSADQVTKLRSRTESISASVRLIQDISDQTNLLALNAAIEAARAGEHGRGFAVVADEVRKLAERTVSVTEEINASIGTIGIETQQSVDQIEETRRVADENAQLSAEADDKLREIVESIESVRGQIGNVSRSMAEVTQAASQVAQAAGEVSGQVEQVHGSIGRFTL